MSNPIAQLFVEIGADISGVSKGLQQTEGLLSGAVGTLGKVALGVGAAGVTALAAGLFKSIEAASEAEQVQAQLGAVLKSTGGKAGITADMANNLASSLQNVTRFEDESVLSGENMLLTFTNIGKDVFPQATQTMLDMSQALGQDVKSSALQLGKALNDPINGMTALQRVGVTFTDAQQNQIKALQDSGDLMGAQMVILKELQKEFGGAAVAAGDTFAGKLDILKNKVGDIMETIGGALIPLLTQGATALIAFLNNPQVQAGLSQLVSGVKEVWLNFSAFVTQLSTLDLGAALAGLGNTDLGGSFGDIFAGLLAAGQNLMTWITGTLAPTLAESFAQITTAAAPLIQQLSDWINTTMLPALQQLAQWLGPVLALGFAQLGAQIIQFIQIATQSAVWVLTVGIPAFMQFAQMVGTTVANAFTAAGQLWQILLIGFRQAGVFIEDAKQRLQALADTLLGPVTAAFQWFMTNVLDPIKEALAALRNYISLTIDALNHLGSLASGAGIPNPFGGAKAAGGAVASGRTYLVGERGPELFTPGSNGGITPNSALGGGTMVNVYVTYAPTVSLMDEQEAEAKLMPFVQAAVRQALAA